MIVMLMISSSLAAFGADAASDVSTPRPIRVRTQPTVTVGQNEGDIQGKDTRAIQAAIDYMSQLGGGVVHVLPGVYAVNNTVHLRSGVTLRGSGDNTILMKRPCKTTKLIRDTDWYEYAVQVEDPTGFEPGGGLALSKNGDLELTFFTISAVKGNVIYLNECVDMGEKMTKRNFWVANQSVASTSFSIIDGWSVNDVKIEDIVLDGDRADNPLINGNFAGAVFTQDCNRWSFKNVTARNFNGDGFSCQVCDDFHFEACHSLGNGGLGFHIGSGAQRPIFRSCVSNGNSQGFFWCWGATDGLAENCTASDNDLYGFNFGHRDRDNIVRGATVERNGKVGILFREEDEPFQAADGNRIVNCLIRDNGGKDSGFGIDIQFTTKDINIENCRFENTSNGKQITAIRMGKDVGRVTLKENKFTGSSKQTDDQRAVK
jgi:hypothetical protein